MANHCKKHKRFIPSCRECLKARDTEQKPKGDPFLRKEDLQHVMPKDDKGREVFFRKFEKIVVVPNSFPEIETYFICFDQWGYDFVSQLQLPRIGDVCLIFKRRD